MIGSALATIFVALAAMTPGAIIASRHSSDMSRWAALATLSLAATMMATALLGATVHVATGAGVPAWALAPVSLIAALPALLWPRATWHRPAIEWPGVLLVALIVAYGIYTYSISLAQLPGGDLRVHAWYNADWFKHLGHTFALGDYGMPARDIFADARPLHYYWLFYVLPGAGTALGNDGWAALSAANGIAVCLLWLTFYGLVRAMDIPPSAAAITVLVTTLAVAPMLGWLNIAQHGLNGLLNAADAPLGPPLLNLALYIPQHALALAVFLSWATLLLRGDLSGRTARRFLALAGLATLLTLSTLFGAAMLGCYGIVELRRRKLAALPELAIMASLSALLVLALGVIKLGQPESAMLSPALQDWNTDMPLAARIGRSVGLLLESTGLPFYLAVFLCFKWRPQTPVQVDAKIIAAVLLLVAAGLSVILEPLLGPRLAQEMRMRVINLPAISAAMIGGAMAWQAWRESPGKRGTIVAGTLALLVIAAPAAAIRTRWHGNATDAYSTVIPRDDRAVLAALRAASDPRDRVWQFPEKPFLSDMAGRDSWAVILAGRTVIASERATDYPAAVPDIDRATRWFAGEPAPVPAAARWVYLSRSLHPTTYDALVSRLQRDNAWRRQACYADACLFVRTVAR